MKKITLLATLALMLGLVACNNDDDRNDTPPPPPAKMEAKRVNGTTGVETAWSMSNPKATTNFFTGATITGIDASTGEVLTMVIPDFEVGFYLSEGAQSLGGVSTYVRQTGGVQYTSGVSAPAGQQQATHFIEITSIDTVKATFNGTFTLVLLNPLGLPNDFYFFEEGILENVPYEEEEFEFGGGDMTAKIDGTDFSSFIASGDLFDNQLDLSGVSIDFRTITISVPSNIAAGTYQMGVNSANPENTGSVNVTLFEESIAQTGNLVISAHNTTAKTISGTFNFEAEGSLGNTISVTEGAFSIEY